MLFSINLKIKNFLTNKEYHYFLILLIFYFFSSFLEIFSISLIPVFVSFLIDKNIFKEVIQNFTYIDFNFLLSLTTKKLLTYSAILIIFFFLFKNMYMILLYYFQNYFNYKVTVDKSNKLFSSYIKNDYSFHLNKNSSNLIKNLTQEVHVSVGYINMLLDFLKEILLFLLIFIVLFVSTPTKLFFISSLLLLSVIIFYMLLKKKVQNKGEIHYKTRDRLFFTLDQSFGFIKEIKVVNNLLPFLNKFKFLVEKTNFQIIIIEVLNKLPRLFFELLAVAICLGIIILSFDNLGAKIIPVVSLYAVCFIRLIPSYTSISTIILNLQFYKPSFEMISRELAYADKLKRNKPNITKKKISYKKNCKIHFNNVSFGYSSNKKVLKNISFSFNSNQSIGIIGPSGSGKTTLGDLFLGLYKPNKGKIYFDKSDIHSLDNNWNNLVSYLPQEPFMLDENIKNNIIMGSDNFFDKKRFEIATKLSNCIEFVRKFKHKFNTRVGQRGIKLSGGQKKRIGIARAIYQNKPILLLDEATSNLDPENDKLVMNSLKILKKTKTILMITHKVSNLKYMDKVIYINNGNIEKIGKPKLVSNYILRKKISELKNLSLD